MNQKTAQFINLIYFIPTSLISILIFSKQKLIDFKTAITISISGIVGATIGAMISKNMSTNILRKIFALFLMTIAICEIVQWFKKYVKNSKWENIKFFIKYYLKDARDGIIKFSSSIISKVQNKRITNYLWSIILTMQGECKFPLFRK